jgi:hypothetical protein
MSIIDTVKIKPQMADQTSTENPGWSSAAA